MTLVVDFIEIVKEAWLSYDKSRPIRRITDISAKVSTNHVYKVELEGKNFVIAKLSYFGKFEHFVEDHTIINSMSNNLPKPFENFLARSLIKGNQLFVHHYTNELIDAWVVFYRPVRIKSRLPKRLDGIQIQKLGRQAALFHKACYDIRNTLPVSSKTLKTDINCLQKVLLSEEGQFEHRMMHDPIKRQCEVFLENIERLNVEQYLPKMPVFVDWNIGNFSVTSAFNFYSRWDYDWFRISFRVLDFYFFSRVSSDIGDRSVFSYYVTTLTEERFLLFLKAYHSVYPLTELDIKMIKEAYRFFILNYVIKDGRYFFHEMFATKLQKEAYDIYFPSIETDFDEEVILKALRI